MKWLLLLPFILQAIVILVDEFYFHWKRSLPLWEKVSHPLDVCTLLGCFLWLANTSYSEQNLLIFTGLATFSCIFVTKEEWIHARLCDAGEQWIHSLLFLLQPAALISAGVILAHQSPTAATPTSLEAAASWLYPIIPLQIGFQLAFLVYQIVFWGFIRKSAEAKAFGTKRIQTNNSPEPSLITNAPLTNT
jgi:hypothetical protein